MKKLEQRELKYLGGIAKIKIVVKQKSSEEIQTRIYELAKSIPTYKFEQVSLSLEKPKTVCLNKCNGSISRLQR